MSIPKSIICRHKKTWFDSLSIEQLKELCKAADVFHTSRKKIDLIINLCESQNSNRFASITVKSVKEMCRSRSIPITGLKYHLVLRILRHDHEITGDVKASTSLDSINPKNVVSNQRSSATQTIYDRIEREIAQGWGVYGLLAETMKSIRNDLRRTSDFKDPVRGFKEAEAAFAALIENFGCIRNVRVDSRDNISVAIDHLASILFEVQSSLDNSEKEKAIKWIEELDHILSEYMIGDNSKTSLKDLARLLGKCAGPVSYKENTKPESKLSFASKVMIKKTKVEITGTSLKSLKNDAKICSNATATNAAAVIPTKTPTKKMITNKKEIVYQKITNVIQKSGDSGYIYEYLVLVMRSIMSQVDDYEALNLFESVFLALVVHFQYIKNPAKDTGHRFTTAIEMLGNVVEAVLGVLSEEEKQKTLHWMTDLGKVANFHALGDTAAIPLTELIRMVEESKEKITKMKPRRFFLS